MRLLAGRHGWSPTGGRCVGQMDVRGYWAERARTPKVTGAAESALADEMGPGTAWGSVTDQIPGRFNSWLPRRCCWRIRILVAWQSWFFARVAAE